MPDVEKIGTPKEVWIRCPQCNQIFYIHRLFYEPKYNQLKLHCPFCHTEFEKEKASRIWGA